MKKFLAVILSVMMVLSVGFTSVVAYAAPDIESQETTVKKVKPNVTVNGNVTNDVEIDVDDNNPNKITFTYTGDGDITGWDFYDGEGNLLVEGEDYTVVFDGNKAIVTVLSNIEEIIADAIIEGEENPTKPTKPNHNNESPNTGAMGLTGLAVAGAGVAILTAMKRKSDAE